MDIVILRWMFSIVREFTIISRLSNRVLGVLGSSVLRYVERNVEYSHLSAILLHCSHHFRLKHVVTVKEGD